MFELIFINIVLGYSIALILLYLARTFLPAVLEQITMHLSASQGTELLLEDLLVEKQQHYSNYDN